MLSSFTYSIIEKRGTTTSQMLLRLWASRLLLVAAFHALGLAAQQDKLYWSNFIGGTIMRANLADGSDVEVVSAHVDLPWGMVIDSARCTMYWSSARGRSIMRANLDGTRATVFATTSRHQARAIWHSQEEDMLYWIEEDSRIRRTSLAGNGSIVEELPNQDTGFFADWAGVAVDSSRQPPRVYISDVFNYGISRQDWGTQESELWVEEDWDILGEAGCLGIDPVDRKLYWADTYDKEIRRISFDSDGYTGIERVITALKMPEGLLIDPLARKMYYSDSDHSKANRIVQADLDGNTEWTINLAGDPSPMALAILNWSAAEVAGCFITSTTTTTSTTTSSTTTSTSSTTPTSTTVTTTSTLTSSSVTSTWTSSTATGTDTTMTMTLSTSTLTTTTSTSATATISTATSSTSTSATLTSTSATTTITTYTGSTSTLTTMSDTTTSTTGTSAAEADSTSVAERSSSGSSPSVSAPTTTSSTTNHEADSTSVAERSSSGNSPSVSAPTTTSSTTNHEVLLIEGSLQLSVSQPDAFTWDPVSNPALTAALARGIENALPGVEHGAVEILDVTVGRSLSTLRRLTHAVVNVDYRVVMAADVAEASNITAGGIPERAGALQGNIAASLASMDGMASIVVHDVIASEPTLSRAWSDSIAGPIATRGPTTTTTWSIPAQLAGAAEEGEDEEMAGAAAAAGVILSLLGLVVVVLSALFVQHKRRGSPLDSYWSALIRALGVQPAMRGRQYSLEDDFAGAGVPKASSSPQKVGAPPRGGAVLVDILPDGGDAELQEHRVGVHLLPSPSRRGQYKRELDDKNDKAEEKEFGSTLSGKMPPALLARVLTPESVAIEEEMLPTVPPTTQAQAAIFALGSEEQPKVPASSQASIAETTLPLAAPAAQAPPHALVDDFLPASSRLLLCPAPDLDSGPCCGSGSIPEPGDDGSLPSMPHRARTDLFTTDSPHRPARRQVAL